MKQIDFFKKLIWSLKLPLLIAISVIMLQLGHCDEPLVVNLSTENQLLPLYLSQILDDNSGLSKEYIKKLESVLHFDLNFNGMTYVVKPTPETANLDAASSFSSPQGLSNWKKHRIQYVVKARIANKMLGVKILLTNRNSIKQIDGIALTGILAEDRRKIHQLADAIFKTLFNQEGIADTHLLYTLKMKNSSSSKATSEVIQSDYDGSNAKALTAQRALCVSPCYIPAKPGYLSKNFAYVSYKTGQPKIYFSTIDEDHAVRFSLLKGNQFMPAFSPSCDKIAFICDVTGNPDLFVQDLDPEKGPVGKPVQVFTANYGTQATPTFSPDGKKIAFVSNKDGAPRIYVTSVPSQSKKSQGTLLTKKNRENTSPCWSPDGKKIAYSALTKGVRQIWIYDFDTGQEKQLTDGPHHKENPCFAPNSLHLAFNSNEGEQAEIYVMHLNQSQAIKITNGKGDKRFPSWEPKNR